MISGSKIPNVNTYFCIGLRIAPILSCSHSVPICTMTPFAFFSKTHNFNILLFIPQKKKKKPLLIIAKLNSWTSYRKIGKFTCFSMIRSSSWRLALLPRREVSIADGFNEAFCPEIFIIQFKKIRHFFKKIIQIQIHIYEGISSINKHNYPTATFGFHFRAKILTVKKKKKPLFLC